MIIAPVVQMRKPRSGSRSDFPGIQPQARGSLPWVLAAHFLKVPQWSPNSSLISWALQLAQGAVKWLQVSRQGMSC